MTLRPISFLRAAAALGAALALGAAQAAAPMARTQAPGYFRLMLGQFEVTALNDGTVDLPMDKFLKEPEAKTKAALSRAYLTVPTETSVNAFLVNTGSKLVLVDAGAGGLFGPTLGGLVASLKAAGYQPEQVDDVVITHMHGDHVGGLSAAAKPVFPNATLHADQHDADHWLSKANLDKAPADMKDSFQGPMDAVNPYIAAGRFKAITGNGEIVPGVSSRATYGHTPGHTVYVVESQGQKLVLIGDLIHVGAVQFAHPEVTIQFDSDSKAAQAQRATVFRELAKDGAWVGAAHIQFPGLGHLRAAGAGYDWIPVNWTENRPAK